MSATTAASAGNTIAEASAPLGSADAGPAATRAASGGELHGKEAELQARIGKVETALRVARDTNAADFARLGEEFRAAREECAALRAFVARIRGIDAYAVDLLAAKDALMGSVGQMTELLMKTNAEGHQLREALKKARSEHAAEMRALRFQHQSELITQLENQRAAARSEGFVAGLRHMRRLAVARYPDVVDPMELKHDLLPDHDDDGGGDVGLPPQPAADHHQ